MTAGYVYKNGKWVWTQTPLKDKASQKKYAAYRANPAHYLIDDGYAKARERQSAAARAQAQAQAAKRDAERRKQDGILGNIKKGNWGDAWHNTKVGVKDWASDWRNWADVLVLGTCAVGAVASGGAAAALCIPLTVAVIGTKFGEDVYNEGWVYGGNALLWNAGFATLGGKAGAAFSKPVTQYLNNHGVRTLVRGARHAVGKGRHRAVPTPAYRGAMAGVSLATTVPACGIDLPYCP
ncbi:hypothetical protein [Streptomyces sp. TP-A0874]|uniref:hypothetical protein n=1 Tax=Streptomyces sp. TP-A0874 TaxID=549819 RepID=UPI001112F9C1|nr:hypothetical protein [Streptomyces sp. TP-A0874]